MKSNLPYEVGTRYSNSEWYDEATSEICHGWQVFEQKSPEGVPTGRKSFVDNKGGLCGVEIAESKRKQAITDSAPELLALLQESTYYMTFDKGNAYIQVAYMRKQDDLLRRINALILKSAGVQA